MDLHAQFLRPWRVRVCLVDLMVAERKTATGVVLDHHQWGRLEEHWNLSQKKTEVDS